MPEQILFGAGGASEATLQLLKALLEGTLNVADSAEREYIHVTATVSSLGDTIVYDPTPGKAVRVRWVYAVNEPTATSAPLIKIKLGDAEIYRAWAISKRQVKTGAVDDPVIVNLSGSGGNVAVTVILEEV